jgi:phosphoribosylanthranilate isomerase
VAGRVITQIYEVQAPEEAEALVRLGVDHIGSVVLSAKDWKQAPIRESMDFIAGTSARSSLILLYHDMDTVFSSLDYYRPDIVHFCEALYDHNGRWTLAEYCRPYIRLQAEIKKNFPEIRIMRSIPIPVNGAFGDVPVMKLAELFEPVSDYFLTDTLIVDGNGEKDQPVEGFVGITGRVCDWHTAAQLVESSRIPVILAGGLSPDNVYEGVITVRPAGVDSCTGTNRVDDRGMPIRFQKDMDKVKRFVEEARRAEQGV